MTTAFVFDVDGTITESRQWIPNKWSEPFVKLCKAEDVYLVTGSDFAKTKEQLEDITKLVTASYQCAGNETWVGDVLVSTSPMFKPSKKLRDVMSSELDRSMCPARTGNHFDYRAGMVNLSTVGRNATNDQRYEYIDFDKKHHEREDMAEFINMMCGDEVTAQIAGKTGIDIFEHGRDKSQVYNKLKPMYNQIVFFGDDCQQGGNDYPFAVKCNGDDVVHHVSSPDETYTILKDNYGTF